MHPSLLDLDLDLDIYIEILLNTYTNRYLRLEGGIRVVGSAADEHALGVVDRCVDTHTHTHIYIDIDIDIKIYICFVYLGVITWLECGVCVVCWD